MSLRRRFVVMDCDGTVIAELRYLKDSNQVALIPGAADALRRFSEIGLGTVMLTNQFGVGQGLFDYECVHAIQARLLDLLDPPGVHVGGVHYCPHRFEDSCSCRKPCPGLIHRAASEFEFDARSCFVIGDKARDIGLGRGVGVTTILVRAGYGFRLAADSTLKPDYVIDDLGDAARIVEGLLDEPFGEGN